MITLTSKVQGRMFFPPKTLPSNNGGSPLVMAQVLIVDSENQSIDVASVLNAPSNLSPGDYEFTVEPRPKSGKPGQNLWYVSAQKKGG